MSKIVGHGEMVRVTPRTPVFRIDAQFPVSVFKRH